MSTLASQQSPQLRAFETRDRDWGTIFTHAILLVAVFTALFPSYFMFTTSFKTNDEYRFNKIGLPKQIMLHQYEEAIFQNEFIRWMLNSATFALGSVALSTVVSALAAFAIARMRFRGQNALLALSTSLMVIPPVVLVVPLFLLFTQLELISTYHGTILIYAGLITPFSVYLLVSFFRTLPTEILEATLIDGASPSGVLWRVVVPLSALALVTLLIVNTLYVWNDLLIALLFLQDDNKRTLMVGISVFQGRYNHQTPLTMAGMVMASLPMLILYMLFQRFFIRGLASGALKG